MKIQLRDGSSIEVDELFIESSEQSEALLNKIKSYSLKYISDACKTHPKGKEGIANAIVHFINKLYDNGSVMQTYRIAKQIEDLGF